MDGDNMNEIPKGTQDIKRFVFVRIAQNKTAWIWRIFGVVFDNLAVRNNFLNFGQRYTSGIAASQGMPGNLKLASIKFFSYLLEHLKRNHNRMVSECQETRDGNELSQTHIKINRDISIYAGRK